MAKTSGAKIKASVKSHVRKTGKTATADKPIIVNVDYNPREDYALRSFVKRLKRIV